MGVKQWVFQRISNALIVLFGLWLLITVMSQGGISLEAIQASLGNASCRLALMVLLVVAGLNSMLAGWQIAGDYAEKFGINQNLMVGTCLVISAGYVAAGSVLIG